MPTVKRKGGTHKPPAAPPRSSADSRSAVTSPSTEVSEAAVKLLDSLTRLTDALIEAVKEDRR